MRGMITVNDGRSVCGGRGGENDAGNECGPMRTRVVSVRRPEYIVGSALVLYNRGRK